VGPSGTQSFRQVESRTPHVNLVRFPAEAGMFLFTTAFEPSLRPTQRQIQWIPGALSPRVERPWREANYTATSNAEVKNAWSFTFTLAYTLMVWSFIKLRDNFILLTHVKFRQSIHDLSACRFFEFYIKIAQ
jgi:hypothetical protein